MTVVVRPIEAKDRSPWERLFVAYGEFYETSFTPDVLDGVWGWLMDATHEVSALVAVADSGDGDPSALLVGFAHYRRQADTFTAAAGWFLDDLYVDASARGTGTATALIDAVAERATLAGGGTLRWITAADNHTAQRVYDRVADRSTWVTYERKT
ncbi:N-acetyltransferase family protein [Conyzicola sp.]|uniref:GNAT family N-acetyltransferase n=1 Tax=Conyzicola sp. TaxID=1969404 RepID=UPI003989F8E3